MPYLMVGGKSGGLTGKMPYFMSIGGLGPKLGGGYIGGNGMKGDGINTAGGPKGGIGKFGGTG